MPNPISEFRCDKCGLYVANSGDDSIEMGEGERAPLWCYRCLQRYKGVDLLAWRAGGAA